NPDPLNLPDAVLARPSLVAIFDSVKHEIVLIAAAYPDSGADADTAFSAAIARLDEFEDRLRGPLPIQREAESVPAPDFH
ncbi:MAG: anthranilate synthase component I, partial [Brevundimonas sp.]